VTDAIVVGVDVGSGASRAAAFACDGTPLDDPASVPYDLPTGLPEGWAEVDPRRWRETAAAALRALGGQVDLSRAVGVGISTIFPAAVAMDDQGSPLRPALLYCDQRSGDQVAWLAERGLDREIERVTGNRVAPGTAAVTSWLWLRDREPDTFARARWLGHANTYLAHWLTGGIFIDASNASISGLLDPVARDWASPLVDAVGLPAAKLPPVVESAASAGTVTEAAARETGLPAGIPVAIGAGDTLCATLGAGAIEAGQAFVTTGTTDTVCVCLDRCAFDRRLYLCCHAVADRWVSIAPMSSTGGNLAWFRDAMAAGEDYADLIAGADAADPAAVTFLPYLRGERSPIWDSDARGAFAGLSLATRRGDLARAILEATGYMLRHNLEAIEDAHHMRISRIAIAGRPSSSPVWNQTRADASGRALAALAYPDMAARGAALLGAIAAGVADAGAWAQGVERGAAEFTPRAELSERYERGYRRYLDLYRVSSEQSTVSSEK
jgi:xylulokinase